MSYSNLFVLLQGPSDGYFLVVRATSEKHFSLVDNGWQEIHSGSRFECEEMEQVFESHSDLIELYCEESHSMIQTTEDCLKDILVNNPEFLNNKEFI